MNAPARRVAVLVEVDHVMAVRLERDVDQVIEEDLAVDGIQGVTHTRFVIAEIPVHVVQRVRHGIDGVNHEAELRVLHVLER